MNRFFASFIKEFLLLVRDRAGMITLFVMPMLLVFILTMIEDTAINTVSDREINLLYCDKDHDSLGIGIREGLENSLAFTIIESYEGKSLDDDLTRELVSNGTYPVGIVVPAGATDTLESNARNAVRKTFFDMGLIEKEEDLTYDSIPITIYYDPAVKNSLKAVVDGAIGQYSAYIVGRMIAKMYSDMLSDVLPGNEKLNVDYPQMITIKKQYAYKEESKVDPNSTQHNVPSWTLFAMFFIVIPLAGSIIQEKEGGTYLRLMTMPKTYISTFAGKIVLYFLVCILQVVILFNMGIYLIPLTGLPGLQLGSHFWVLALVVASASYAAVGFGVMIGSITTTYQQAASIGVVTIIIMASLGGLWMPLYFMPKSMQSITVYSPMNWLLRNFYDIFLRDAGFREVLPNVLKAIAFGSASFVVAFAYKALKKVR